MKIVPSILTDQLEQLRDILKTAERFADYVQIDFMDGLFVPSKGVLPQDMNSITTVLAREAHLMVEKPEEYLNDLKLLGFTRIIFHCEANTHPRGIIRRIKEQGMEAGMAINPETESSRLENFVSQLDSVLFLSVSPGFYGSPFIPSVLQKIGKFRERHPTMVIGIDGGVALDNISEIKSLGVNYACVGSRIFLSEDPVGSYREFERSVHG